MRRVARFLIVLVCLVITMQAFVLWDATGRRGFTRFRIAEPAAQSPEQPNQDALDALLAESGLEDRTGPMPHRDNAFALGLLPGGFDAHAVSVLTLAGPALLGAVLALLPARRKSA
ncbi:MAG: hypothetical protein ACF8QF_05005 [Phycisphaerales bacterium]